MTANAGRSMTLTPELVARVAREVLDAGPEPGAVELGDADYVRAARRLREQAAGEVWLFAYGSLIWKPEVEHVEERVGTARAGTAPSACG